MLAGGAAHRQLAVVGGGGDHERPEVDADEAGEMHTPTRVAAGHHRRGGVECHGHCLGPAETSTARSAPVAASQILRVPSSPAETIQAPSGLTAQPFTAVGVAGEGGPFAPVAASQILRVPSCWRRRSRCRPGSPHNHAPSRVPVRVARSAPRGGVPDPEGAVAAGGDDPGAVRAHRTAIHRLGVAGEGGPFGPVAASQILRVWSLLAETIQAPSGLTAQAFTLPVWPVRVAVRRRWRRPRS